MDNSTDNKSLQSEDNCARLTAYLMHKYGWTVEKNLFTHTYWLHIRDGHSGTIDQLNVRNHTYKNCPQYIIPHWNSFKVKVKSYLDELNGKSTTSNTTEFQPYLIKVTSEDGFVNVRKTPTWDDDDIVTKVENSNTKYTIVAETTFDGVTFGKLKSGLGWVALNCCTKV
jgi:hypothetical protein